MILFDWTQKEEKLGCSRGHRHFSVLTLGLQQQGHAVVQFAFKVELARREKGAGAMVQKPCFNAWFFIGSRRRS